MVELKGLQVSTQELATLLTELFEEPSKLENLIDKFDIQFKEICEKSSKRVENAGKPFILHPKPGSTAEEFEILLPPGKTSIEYLEAIVKKKPFTCLKRPISKWNLEEDLVGQFQERSDKILEHPYKAKELTLQKNFHQLDELLFRNFDLDSSKHLVVKSNPSLPVPKKCSESLASLLFNISLRPALCVYFPSSHETIIKYVESCANSITGKGKEEATKAFVKSVLHGLSSQEAGGKQGFWNSIGMICKKYSFDSSTSSLQKSDATGNLDFSLLDSEELDCSKVVIEKKLKLYEGADVENFYLTYLQDIVSQESFKNRTFDSKSQAFKELLSVSQTSDTCEPNFNSSTPDPRFFSASTITLTELKTFYNNRLNIPSIAIDSTDILKPESNRFFKLDGDTLECSTFPQTENDSQTPQQQIKKYAAHVLTLKTLGNEPLSDFTKDKKGFLKNFFDVFFDGFNLNKTLKSYAKTLGDASKTSELDSAIGKHDGLNKGQNTGNGSGNNGSTNGDSGGWGTFFIVIVLLGVIGAVIYFAYVVPKRRKKSQNKF